MGRIRISGESVNRGPKEQYQQLGFSISRCADKRLVIFSHDTPNMEVIGKYLMEHLCLKSESWKSLSQPCPCLLPSQGNGLWLLERTLQSCRRPWELNIRLPGQHHQSNPHPAGLHRARVWRTGGVSPARHTNPGPDVTGNKPSARCFFLLPCVNSPDRLNTSRFFRYKRWSDVRTLTPAVTET